MRWFVSCLLLMACHTRAGGSGAPTTTPAVPVGADVDADGILDGTDQCPNAPEDMDRYQDGDGCPDDDNDSDQILDVDDQCPCTPENHNGLEDEDGCPDERRVLLPGQEIEIRDKVYFGEGTWKIGEHNDVLLQSIVRALHAHPRIALLAVQGHATSIERMPQRLSEKRAHVVMDALIALGVKSTRLTSRGYGRTKPLKLGTSAEARAHNRRVEFQILKSSEEPVERAQPSPEPVPGCPER